MGLSRIFKQLLVILIVFPLTIQAQTRFCLTQATSPKTPAANAAWNVTTGNAVVTLIPYLIGEAGTSITSGNTGAAAVRKLLIRQYVSAPLIAQTINGTVTGQIRYNMNAVASRSGEGFVYFRVLNADGTVASEVGTLTTSALTTTLTNRTLISLTLTSVNVPAGGRLCFDVGWNYSTGVNTTTTGTIAVRTVGPSTFLPVDNTTTTASTPWIEFSQTIFFQSINFSFF